MDADGLPARRGARESSAPLTARDGYGAASGSFAFTGVRAAIIGMALGGLMAGGGRTALGQTGNRALGGLGGGGNHHPFDRRLEGTGDTPGRRGAQSEGIRGARGDGAALFPGAKAIRPRAGAPWARAVAGERLITLAAMGIASQPTKACRRLKAPDMK